MKKIEAIIRPENLEAVKDALVAAGHAGLTVVDAKGHGIQQGVVTNVGGEKVVVDLLPKLYITAVVHDHEVDAIIDAIVSASRSGNVGDGKIFISPVEGVLRVRTGEIGAEAL
ncbi:MAG: P-II family nitrogen regulator [Coriobacteriia bacterium]|nr:P-II family nitrogen regulator [Coriobacteriia bacterium]MBN2822157.1 P-II family nitrogen regulator [Coriobacteriia bacterium]